MNKKKRSIVLKYLLYLQKFYAVTISTNRLSKSNRFLFSDWFHKIACEMHVKIPCKN